MILAFLGRRIRWDVRDYSRMVASHSISEAERQWLRVLGTLNEYQARRFIAQKALELGRGGISRLSWLTGMSRPTITTGIATLRERGPLLPVAASRIRQPGSRRRKVEVAAPAIGRHLGQILEETTTGDPMSFLKWTNKSTQTIATELTRWGHAITPTTVARCLHDLGYCLQANVKTIEGPQHPDRDAQFRYINARVRAFQQTAIVWCRWITSRRSLSAPFGMRCRRGGRA
jgi:Rhodopirellula transposase DDE domain